MGKDIGLWRHRSFWGFHFVFHLMIGIVAISAGIVVIMNEEILSGLGLVGAGLFAVLNGGAGCIELWKSKKSRRSRINISQ
ncbi:hypothetical protein [Pelosinus sp. IPA-1]|uniref:hypothetical protein n=1 Tax=Pelosinus sp. IPA-1 TaxID=3029569 RepID=UPI0024361765|nr:hypothetical protein [Pelosinus sp. IPA-1]GMB01392.1 hypothetical protein PIPA1_41910 [Pelosinus sp. IPA-1]